MDNGAGSYRRFREDGDAEGMAELVREYRDGLILYLDTFVRDIPAAEELAEDVFVLLAVKKPVYKAKSSFKTWLYAIGRNTALDHLRKARRRGEIPLENCGELHADGETLEESFIREERRIAVHRAMRSLPADQRQIIWLMYFEKLTASDAARIMKKSPHAAETLAYRARKALKQKLTEEGFEYEDL